MKTLEVIIQEQLGGLVFMLCERDALIAQLQEENQKLKAAASKDPGQEKK